MKKLFLILLALIALGAQAQVRFEKTVNTVNDLQNLQPDDIHDVVFVKGYASAGAADGATFVYDPTSAAATNTVSVFKPTSVSGNGRWIRQDLMFQAGSATVPSITFGLDNNTGFANSASDQLDIITGGTRRGYVDSSGSFRLTSGVASSSTTTGTAIITGGLGLSGALNAGGVANVTDTTEATTGGVAALKSSGGIYAAKKIVGNTDLIVNTSLVYADSAASKVGIGTTGPDRKLDVLDASNPQMRLTQTDGTVYTEAQTLSTGHLVVTTTGGNRITSTTVNDTSVLARQVQGGLAFDGVTTTAKDVHTIGADIGTGDFTYSTTLLCPTSTDTPDRYVFELTPSSTTIASPSKAGAEFLVSLGKLQVYVTGTTYPGVSKYYTMDVSGVITAYGGKIINITVVRSNGVGYVYIQGILQTTTDTSSSGGSFADTVTSTYLIPGGIATGNNGFKGTIYSATLFNRALSASEVITLANQGVSEADKWGSLTAIISPSVLNGGFETLGGGGADVYATWVENLTGTGTIVNETVDVYAGVNSCKLNGGASGTAQLYQNAALVAGKWYRVSYYGKSTGGGSVRMRVGGLSPTPQVLTGTWTQYSFDVINTGSAPAFFYLETSSNTDVLIDNITVSRIGSILDASLSAGVGYQAPDRSSNHYDGLISTTGVSHTIEQRRGQARFSLSADGYLGDTTSRACIPADARIESIVAYSTGTPTFTIGDDSGAAANVVGAVTLSASTVTDLTLLKRFTTTGTKGRIYVDFTAGAAATTFTVNYTTTGNY